MANEAGAAIDEDVIVIKIDPDVEVVDDERS